MAGSFMCSWTAAPSPRRRWPSRRPSGPPSRCSPRARGSRDNARPRQRKPCGRFVLARRHQNRIRMMTNSPLRTEQQPEKSMVFSPHGRRPKGPSAVISTALCSHAHDSFIFVCACSVASYPISGRNTVGPQLNSSRPKSPLQRRFDQITDSLVDAVAQRASSAPPTPTPADIRSQVPQQTKPQDVPSLPIKSGTQKVIPCMQHDLSNLQALLDGYRRGRADQESQRQRLLNEHSRQGLRIKELTDFATFFHFSLNAEIEKHAERIQAFESASGRTSMIFRHLGGVLRNTRDRINPNNRWQALKTALKEWMRGSRDSTRAGMLASVSHSTDESTRAKTRYQELQQHLKRLGLTIIQRWIVTSQDLAREQLIRIIQTWSLRSDVYKGLQRECAASIRQMHLEGNQLRNPNPNPNPDDPISKE